MIEGNLAATARRMREYRARESAQRAENEALAAVARDLAAVLRNCADVGQPLCRGLELGDDARTLAAFARVMFESAQMHQMMRETPERLEMMRL